VNHAIALLTSKLESARQRMQPWDAERIADYEAALAALQVGGKRDDFTGKVTVTVTPEPPAEVAPPEPKTIPGTMAHMAKLLGDKPAAKAKKRKADLPATKE
jgi:hypothetical protein